MGGLLPGVSALIFPFWFLGALLLRALASWVTDPQMPGEGKGALAVTALSGAIILLLFEFLVVIRHFGKTPKLEKGLTSALPFLPWVFSYVIWGVFRLESFVRFDVASNSEALSEMLILLPYLWFELLLLLGEFRVFGSVRSGFRVRATWLVLPFFLLVLLLFDLMGVEPHLRAILNDFSFGLGAGLALSIFILVLLLPLWTRLILGLKPLRDLDLLSGFKQIDEKAKASVAGAYVLPTGKRMFNAAVVGFFRWTRLIMFTDLLLDLLSPRQVFGVYAHEIAHVRQHHMLRLLVFFLLTPWFLSFGIPWFFASTSEDVQLVLFGIFLILLLPFYRSFSRMLECEADLSARSFLGESGPLIESLEEGELLVPGSGANAGFRHPSTNARIQFLERVDEDPGFAKIFRLRMEKFQFGLALLLAIGLGLSFPRLRAGWEEDYPKYLLDIGYPEEAYSKLLDLIAERMVEVGKGAQVKGTKLIVGGSPEIRELDQETRDFLALLDEASRARLLVEARGEKGVQALPILRKLAHRRAAKALSQNDLDASIGWLGLYLRWGDGSVYQTVLYRFLRSLREGDEDEQQIQRKRLGILLAHYKTDRDLIPPQEHMR